MRAKIYIFKYFPPFFTLKICVYCTNSINWPELIIALLRSRGYSSSTPQGVKEKFASLSIRPFVYFFHIWYEFGITTI